MNETAGERGQVTDSAAQVYDEFFVPALFAPWAEPLCRACGVTQGNTVLDVACGTGATTRVAKEMVSPDGAVTGLDCNDGMLAVAQARTPEITWVSGVAESLPFADASFDRVLCQFGLMFFDDRIASLQEMQRVLRPGGAMAVSVWADRGDTSAYARMKVLIEEMFGPEAGRATRAPFALGNEVALRKVIDNAGLTDARIDTPSAQAQYPSIREWMRMDARGWTLAEFIDDDGFEALVTAAETRLSEFAGPDGRVTFPTSAHIVTWQASR